MSANNKNEQMMKLLMSVALSFHKAEDSYIVIGVSESVREILRMASKLDSTDLSSAAESVISKRGADDVAPSLIGVMTSDDGADIPVFAAGIASEKSPGFVVVYDKRSGVVAGLDVETEESFFVTVDTQGSKGGLLSRASVAVDKISLIVREMMSGDMDKETAEKEISRLSNDLSRVLGPGGPFKPSGEPEALSRSSVVSETISALRSLVDGELRPGVRCPSCGAEMERELLGVEYNMGVQIPVYGESLVCTKCGESTSTMVEDSWTTKSLELYMKVEFNLGGKSFVVVTKGSITKEESSDPVEWITPYAQDLAGQILNIVTSTVGTEKSKVSEAVDEVLDSMKGRTTDDGGDTIEDSALSDESPGVLVATVARALIVKAVRYMGAEEVTVVEDESDLVDRTLSVAESSDIAGGIVVGDALKNAVESMFALDVGEHAIVLCHGTPGDTNVEVADVFRRPMYDASGRRSADIVAEASAYVSKYNVGNPEDPIFPVCYISHKEDQYELFFPVTKMSLTVVPGNSVWGIMVERNDL